MKKLLLSLLSVVIVSSAFAQFEYEKMVEKGKAGKAFKKATKALDKDPKSIPANYNLGKLYNISGTKFHHVDSAYFYSTQSLKLLNYADQKVIEKLNKDHLNEPNIHELINEVCSTALREAQVINNVETYNHYLKVFTFNAELTEKATVLRNGKAFKNADETGTIASYQSFINEYPKASEIGQAKSKRNKLAFANALAVHTIEGYQTFIDNYPDAEEASEARFKRDQLAFDKAQIENTSEAMRALIQEYPNSELRPKFEYERDRLDYHETVVPNSPSSNLKYLKTHPHSRYESIIVDSVLRCGIRHKDFYSLQHLAENQTEFGLHDTVWLHYFNAYCHSGESFIIEEFRSEYRYQFPYSDYLSTAYIDALGIEILDDHEINMRNDEVLKYFLKYPDSYRSFRLVHMFAQKHIKAKNWTAASNIVKQAQDYLKNKNKHVNSLQAILTNSDKNIRKNRLSSSVNTTRGGEYAPVISADNKWLYFCGKDRKDNYANEDVFVSKRVGNNWGKPKLIDELCTWKNDAPLSVSTDGNTMIMFREGDLYYSEQKSYGWSELIEFPYPVNSDEWDADAMITSDGKAILFTSAREVDHPDIGGIDIFICLKTEYGWSDPINLGSTINTEFKERSPYLHSDMKTLYFASSGHGGIGEMDVFKSTRLNDSTWTDWSEPVNLGKEINTPGIDWGYKITTDGKKAYFAATNNNDINDIHVVNLPNYLRPGFVATVEGSLKDKDDNPIEATIVWEDLETGKVIGESKSNPKDGSYFIVLPMGKIYGYYINNGDYFPISNNLDLREEDNAIEIDKDIQMVTFDQMIEDGTAVPMNNLFFNTNQSRLLPESKPELKRIAKIISLNNLKVEIAGHTDNVGTDEHNQELSENRAESVKIYLIGLGVPEELLTTIGHGETKPNATNDTEEGKALNRRVELKFID